jgi:hypothetical protein
MSTHEYLDVSKTRVESRLRYLEQKRAAFFCESAADECANFSYQPER